MVYAESLDLSVEPSIQRMHCINATTGDALWTFLVPGGQTGEGNDNAPLLSPDGERMYIVAAGDGEGYYPYAQLIAIDATNGTEQWALNTSYSSNAAITPAIAPDNTLVYTASNGTLVSVCANNGTTNWLFAGSMQSELQYGPTLSPDAKYLYLINQHDVYGIDASDGTQIWKTVGASGDDFPACDPNAPSQECPLLSPDGALLYFTTYAGLLVCLRAADGVKIWDIPTSASIGAFSKNGRSIYLIDDMNVSAVDVTSSGSILWNVNVSSPGSNYTDSIDSFTFSPDMTVMYVSEYVDEDGVNSSSIIHAINTSDGTRIWDTPAGDTNWNVAANPNGKAVYVGGIGDHSITSINAKDGKYTWDFQFGPTSSQPDDFYNWELSATPTCNEDGTVVYAQGGDELFAIKA